MALGVHIFGPGFGESVVLEFPDGSVGVVDAFCDSQGRSPVLEFVTSQLGVDSLAFLAVSHPHADHCNGLRELLEHLAVERLWVFDTIQDANLAQFFRDLYLKGRRDAVEEALKLKPGSVASQLSYLDRTCLVPILKKGAANRFRFFRSSATFKLEDVAVRFLTPGDSALASYRSKLTSALRNVLSDGPALNRDWKPGNLNHNLVSGSIFLEYGDTKILLMGDAEQPLWDEVVDNLSVEGLFPLHLIKAAHHGSINGFAERFFQRAASGDVSIVVVTPFDRLENPLPRSAGIKEINKYALELLCTNRVVAEGSSGLQWEPVSKAPVVATAELVALLSTQPSIKRFFAPELGGPNDVAGDDALPSELVSLIARMPQAVQALHPSLRNRHLVKSRELLVDEFRVSLYFDRNGQEDLSRRHLGWGAGRLLNSAVTTSTGLLKL